MKIEKPSRGSHLASGERYATIFVSINPSELPVPILKRLLSISASKIGSGDVRLASHIMVILNVSFNQRAGRVAPDVLLLKSPIVSACGVGGGESKRE